MKHRPECRRRAGLCYCDLKNTIAKLRPPPLRRQGPSMPLEVEPRAATVEPEEDDGNDSTGAVRRVSRRG